MSEHEVRRMVEDVARLRRERSYWIGAAMLAQCSVTRLGEEADALDAKVEAWVIEEALGGARQAWIADRLGVDPAWVAGVMSKYRKRERKGKEVDHA